jgi:hypothetical protein
VAKLSLPEDVVINTYAGRVHVEWDCDGAVTSLGQLPFFIDFLKAGGLFDNWVADAPLVYRSPNAPKKRDVLGTVMLSILAGHWRYAHMTALRGDLVLPDLLGMERVVSEDAVRRALKTLDEDQASAWCLRHLDNCTVAALRLSANLWITFGLVRTKICSASAPV